MLFNNLHNIELREKFIETLSRETKSSITYLILDSNNRINAYVFSAHYGQNNSYQLLSVYKDREELFSPGSNVNSERISNCIQNFNKMCDRNEKIDAIIL